MHLRSTGRFTDGGSIVGVVLAAFALEPIRGCQVGGDDTSVQTQRDQLASPMVGAGAGFHGDQTACWQLGAPSHEFVAG